MQIEGNEKDVQVQPDLRVQIFVYFSISFLSRLKQILSIHASKWYISTYIHTYRYTYLYITPVCTDLIPMKKSVHFRAWLASFVIKDRDHGGSDYNESCYAFLLQLFVHMLHLHKIRYVSMAGEALMVLSILVHT